MMPQRQILITSALPYANGPLHIGHMVEHIQTNIWARFHNMQDYTCYSVCGDDAHGTPIMLKAESQGLTPEALIETVKASHEADFADFGINYDYYHTTHSSENQQLSALIYERLKKNGDIITKTIRQAYDPEKNMFLPDRYVKGECPVCHTPDQYGDNCEACGATYSPTELINPISSVSGATPIEKESVHFFFDLPRYTELLKTWTRKGHLQTEVANKLDEWFEAGLRTWDISRDAPYFGFEIPGEKDKYFYVWLDAPVGYMASFQKFCESHSDIHFEDFWGKDSQAELYHFIGKDIIYFHALFWPAMLAGAGFRTPTAIYTHGFLTVNGEKMSKSRGTFITARAYLEHLEPDYLRYYFAAKLSNRIDDIDLNLDDFLQRVNSDLVGKVVNIASRCAKFINKHFDNQLAAHVSEPELQQQFVDAGDDIARAYEQREFSRAVRDIMLLSDKANQYIDEHKPWVLHKDPANADHVQAICTQGLNLFRLLIIYLKPILPFTAEAVEIFLQSEPLQWSDKETPLLAKTINTFKPLLQRITPDQIEALKA